MKETVYLKDVYWRKSDEIKPLTGVYVLVHGGIASWDGEVWRSQTGIDYNRVIEWPVLWWAEIPKTTHEYIICMNLTLFGTLYQKGNSRRIIFNRRTGRPMVIKSDQEGQW